MDFRVLRDRDKNKDKIYIENIDKSIKLERDG